MRKITKSLLLVTSSMMIIPFLGGCKIKQDATSTSTSTSSSTSTTTTYDVVFKNYDGSVLYQTKVNAGESAIYEGEDPSKPADVDNYYEFEGWDKPFDNITSDLEVTAIYKSTSNFKDFDVDFEFEVDLGASEYTSQTTNFLGVDEGATVSLVKPVIVDGEEVSSYVVHFDDMTFDYSQVDTSVWDEFDIKITYKGVTKTDVIDVMPDYNNWTNGQHFNFGGKYMEPGPDWSIITYLDLYTEGAMINGCPGEFSGDYYHYEFFDEDGLRFYGKYNGASTDVIYRFVDQTFHQYNKFDNFDDPVMKVTCVVDGETPFFAPQQFELSIYQDLDECTSAYGTAYGDNQYLTPKYDYDPSNKSFKVHLPDYPNPFVYSKADGNYHAQ